MFSVSLRWYETQFPGPWGSSLEVVSEPKEVRYEFCAAYSCAGWVGESCNWQYRDFFRVCIWIAGLIGAALSAQGFGAVTNPGHSGWGSWSGGCTASWAAAATLCCILSTHRIGTCSNDDVGSEYATGFYAQVVASVLGAGLAVAAYRTKAPGQYACTCVTVQRITIPTLPAQGQEQGQGQGQFPQAVHVSVVAVPSAPAPQLPLTDKKSGGCAI